MVSALAIPFAAIALGAGALQIGILAACRLVPGAALGLVAGAWVDRLRRRPVLVAADLVRAVLLLGAPAAAAFGALALWHLYLLSLLLGFFGFVFEVAHHAYLPALVRPERLVDANGKLVAGESVSEGLAFASGGFLVQGLGAPFALALDSASFLASACMIARIDAKEPTPEARAGRRTLDEIRAGLRTVLASPLLRALLAAELLCALALQLTGVVYLLYVHTELGFPEGILGVVFALGAVSSLLGALGAERARARLGAGPAMIGGLALFALAVGLLPLAPGASLAGLGLLALHQLGDGAYVVRGVNDVSLRQRIVPSELLGRVNASLRTTAQGTMLVGTALGSVLGEALGYRATLAASALLLALAATALFASPLRRER
jgi:MFS family permease